MRVKSFLLFRFLFLFGAICLVTSCIKSDNTDLDTKVRFFNVIDEAAQDFYLNKVLVSSSIGYGSNSSYIVTAADKIYTVFAKNTGTQNLSDSISETLKVGRNYSVYYYKSSAKDSLLKVIEDDLTPSKDSARILFINLSYTLASKVSIRNETSSLNFPLGNGESSGYVKVPIAKSSKLSFNLGDSTNVIDTISYTNFNKGKTYTILIDGINKGGSKGKLRERLIANN